MAGTSGANIPEAEYGDVTTVQKTGDKDSNMGVPAKEDLESLKQYMNFLHKNTENKFEEGLMNCKKESRESYLKME